MIIDKLLQVSSAQAIPNGTAVRSDNVIDLGGAVKRIIGPGEPLWWVVAARVGLAADANPTADIKVQTDDNPAFSTPVDLIAYPQLTAFATGSRIVIPMPFVNQRYVSLYYDLGGTNPTLTVDAWLTNQDPTSWVAYEGAPKVGTTTTTTT